MCLEMCIGMHLNSLRTLLSSSSTIEALFYFFDRVLAWKRSMFAAYFSFTRGVVLPLVKV